ncbi:hypothetical protein RDABS01_015682 [Bienertia sinuspersici]
MDFKFRSVDNRSTNRIPSPPKFPGFSSNVSYFNREAIRAGFNVADSSRREFFRNPSPNDFRESVQRELEKERIRAEILAEEVYRRRILEEEVRREMRFEREMALRRARRDLGFGSSSSMQFETRVPLLTNFEHPVGVSPRPKAGSEALPFQRDPVVSGNADGYVTAFPSAVRLKEIKEIKAFDPEVNIDKAIILAKPEATDLKRKATQSPIGATADPSTGSKKPKTQEEWSCALCRVTATSEQALNDHLKGKKHKARESGLNSQRTGFGTGPLPNTVSSSTGKPIKVPGKTNKQSSRKKKDKKTGGETSLGKTDNKSAQELLSIDKKITISEGKETPSKMKNEEAAMPQKTSASAKPKKGLNFLCDICQIRTHSLKVLNAHKKGKPHLAKVKKLNIRAEAASAETPVLKVIVENKEQNMAATVEKGVVEEDKKVYIDAAKEANNERGLVEIKVENKEPDMADSVDKELVQEKKELYIGVANVTEGELKSNKESADNNVIGIEENKVKVL